MTSTQSSVEIVGPFKDYRLVIDGWRVPLMSACEVDGGKVNLTLDNRIGITVPAAQFDQFSRFIADVIGACWGYGAHPRGEVDDHATRFARVPHPALAPARMMEITAVVDDDG